MKVCFTGDLFLGGDLISTQSEIKVNSKLLRNSEQVVVNLEQAVSDSTNVSNKCTLYTNSQQLNLLKGLNVSAVNIAHNHIQDKGLDGIIETKNALAEQGIKSFGAGKDLSEAKEPVYLTDDIALLGYCDFNKKYLSQVEVATDAKPGVNPLRLDNILSDIKVLPKGKKAIVYLHWGIEHVWLSELEDLKIMKTLLEQEQVITVLGMHAHRAQGIVEHNGKKGFMCLGNFLFPNFYISPPTQIAYPSLNESKNVKFETKYYHLVHDLTYKMWLWVNRVSIVVQYDTQNDEINYEFVKQNKDFPLVQSLNAFERTLIGIIVSFVSKLYMLNEAIYVYIQKLEENSLRSIWTLRTRVKYYKQIGFSKLLKKVYGKLRK